MRQMAGHIDPRPPQRRRCCSLHGFEYYNPRRDTRRQDLAIKGACGITFKELDIASRPVVQNDEAEDVLVGLVRAEDCSPGDAAANKNAQFHFVV